MTTTPTELASVRYLIDDVPAAVDFYTTHLGFTVAFDSPVFAAVRRHDTDNRSLSASRSMCDRPTRTTRC